MRSIDMDAVTKTNHFDMCASSTKDIPPNINCHFDGPEATIRQLEKDDELNLKSFVDSDVLLGEWSL